MSAQADWLTDLAQACDELEYSIESITPKQVVLCPKRGISGRERLTIESIFLNGDHLRRLLKPADTFVEMK